MKNFIPFLAFIFFASACDKTEEVATPSVGPLEWRAYSVTTTPASEITSFMATSGGTIGSSGGGNATSERGICYNTSPNPTTSNFKITAGSGAGTFVCVMLELTGNTLYYVKAYAIKSGVTTYGNQVTFTTYADPGTVTDYDGNVYQTINIGGQIWMMENLKTTHYRDGEPIPFVPDDTNWFNLSTGGYCHYNNDSSFVSTYGRLYNWYATANSHNLAPAGWHIPSYAEFDVLKSYLGGPNVAGGKAKETGTSHWTTPNTAATNSSGFNSVPGGARYVNPYGGWTTVFYADLGRISDWWTSTEILDGNPNTARFVETNYNSALMYRSGFLGGIGYYVMGTGYSIRCLKD